MRFFFPSLSLSGVLCLGCVGDEMSGETDGEMGLRLDGLRVDVGHCGVATPAGRKLRLAATGLRLAVGDEMMSTVHR